MTARRRKLEQDDKGRFRPRIGWFVDEHGRRSQPRFNLGSDKREAEIRYARILQLYDEDCRAHSQSEWSLRGLEYARLIASGRTTVEYPPDRGDDGYDPAVVLDEYAAKVDVDRARFPSLDIQPSDPTTFRESVERSEQFVTTRLRELEQEMRQLHALTRKDQIPDRLIVGTLHEALDAYAESIQRDGERLPTGELKPSQRSRLDMVERLKQSHRDIPLHALNYDTCSGLIAYWRNRPITRRGTRSKGRSATNMLKELDRFYRWLDVTSEFEWAMPRGLANVSRKIVKLEGEKKLSAVTKNTYSPGQLAFLNKHASPLERTALYLGLNCAMGAAELGRLVVGDFDLKCRHPHADRLGFDSSAEDSFVRYFRPKTEVFGEWLLWPETVQMVEWAMRRARRIGSNVLFVRETGAPMYNESAKNAQSEFANLWNRLQDRARKSDPEFPYLPFGTLRDTLPEVLRRDHSDELASMVLTHGKPSKADSLLECYANKPYGRYHRALRDLHRHYQPVFAAVVEPLQEGKQYIPVAVMERVREMIAAGRGTTETARACGVSTMTVLRERKKLARPAAPAG